MGQLPVSQVCAASSDAEIKEAISIAGEHRYPWRREDWPKEGEDKSWVKPTDIGYSTREKGGDALLIRLKRMVASGILEQKYVSRLPRFRVRVEK